MSIISEQKKHPATCKFILKLTKNFFNYYLHLLILNQITAATPKPRRSRPVECCILSISGTQPDRGIFSIFWTFPAAGRAPSTSFLFIITNYEFHFLQLSIHLAQYIAQQFPQNINPSHSPKSPNITLISPSQHSITLSTLSSLPPGTFSLIKISQNTPLYPLLYTPSNHSLSHPKCLKMA